MPTDLPTFVILGAAKSGTTSLWKGLQGHPDVFVSPTKEVHFFDDDANWNQGVDRYRAFFEGHRSERAVGEATPSYLATAAVPARMGSTVPEARLIAVLRDPVERAYSWYFHMRYYGWESRSFDDAVAEELRTPGWDLEPRYLANGRYAEQLERFGEHFERSRILVELLDDLHAAPAPTFQRVLAHIGVDPHLASFPDVAENTFRAIRFEPLARKLMTDKVVRGPRMWRLMYRIFTNTGGTAPPMNPRTERMLYEAFAEDNERLAAWLGRDLPEWADRAADSKA